MTTTLQPPRTPPPAGPPLEDALKRIAEVARARRRRWLIAAGSLSVLVFALFAARVLLGDYTVTIPDFFRLLGGENIPGARFIVMESKLPRAVMAVLAGACFGTAGALFQTMLRNPLASPDVIGISVGASASAVFAIVVLGVGGTAIPVAALIGALVIATAIFTLSRHRSASGLRLILVGIGFAAALQAIILHLLARAGTYQANDALQWLIGSLNAASWQRISALGIGMLIVLPFLIGFSRRLSALVLGDDLAAGLGLNANRTRLGLLVVGVALTAFATAASGPIAFVALLSGPIARRLNGGRATIVIAALVGMAIVLATDYIGAYMLPSGVVPVGVLTGALGAPFMLWLLLTRHGDTGES